MSLLWRITLKDASSIDFDCARTGEIPVAVFAEPVDLWQIVGALVDEDGTP